MKKLFITAIFFSIALSVFAQSPSAGRNYVMETVVKMPGKKTKADLAGLPVDSVNRTIQYFDGLGRPLQTVQWQASPLKKDLVSHVIYDGLGREAVKLLPYAAQTDTNGSFKATPLADQAAFYSSSSWDANIARTDYPFSKTVFESSPLSRPIDQGSPGAVWQPYSAAISGSGHTLRPEYQLNLAGEVPLWRVNPTGGATTSATYAAGSLYKNIVKDENWTSGKGGTVAEFKDKDGRIVLKRQWRSDTDSLSTYYIYDPYGNLAYVIPPKAATITTFTESNGSFKNYIYGYHYDGRKRLIQKKVPGKGWEYMVYNKLDQLVLSQDGVQLATHKWLFNKYDQLGRVILTGIISSTSSRGTWQSTIDADTVLWEVRDNANASSTGTGYTNHAKPAHSQVDSYYTINYYDDYDFYGYSTTYDPTLTVSSRTTGLPTATKVNTLGSSTMLLSVMYYDEKGRNIENIADNHLSGTDRILNTYDFTGQLMASTRIHTVSSTTTTIANSYTYDHEGRKVSTKENINSQGEVVLNKLVYNEAGQLKQKYLHSTNGGSTFLQDTKFAYNERGWLKGSNSAEFKMKLGYDTLSNPQYNGNIATQLWGTSYGNKFLYTYDKINRLTNGTSTGIVMSEVLSYDNMGNIASLNRDGAGAAVYHYNGNQLDSISGGGLTTAHYAYDVNGNATTDGRNRVALTYNVLNLPATVTKSGLSLAYTYDATGQKLKKVSNTNGTTDYLDGIQYQDGVIDFIQTEEGRALNSGGTYTYQYNLTDHLGNVRYSFDIDSGAIRKLAEDNYYPFGKQKTVTGGTNQYLYNGKELQDELAQYDYGARFYDAEIGRWNVIDPMTEKFYSINPYNFTDNNPINNIDPNGMDTYYGDEAREFLRQIQNNLQDSEDNPKSKKQTKKKKNATETAKEILKENWFIRLFAGREVMNLGKALDAYDDEGLNGYLYTSISNAHQEIGMDFANGQYINPWGSTEVVFTSGINKGVFDKFLKHAFSNNRHNDLGLPIESIANKVFNLVAKNLSVLKKGDNTLTVTINGIQKTIMANVENGAVRSINMYSGISKRVTNGNIINLGKVKW